MPDSPLRHAWRSTRWRMLAATVGLWTAASGLILGVMLVSQRRSLESQKRADWIALTRARRSHINSLVDLTVKQVQAVVRRNPAMTRLLVPQDLSSRFDRAIAQPVLSVKRVVYLTKRIDEWSRLKDLPTDLLRVWLHEPQALTLLHMEDQSGGWLVFYAVIPVPSAGGRINGWICAEISAASLENLLLDRTSMGETGEIYIVSRDGWMLSRSRFHNTGSGKRIKIDSPVAKAARDGANHPAQVYKSYRGVDVLGIGLYLPEFDWTLVAEIARSEVVSPLGRVLPPLIAIWIMMSFSGALLLRYLWSPVLDRIKILGDLAQRIGEGEFISAPVGWKDEFGLLAQRFTEMSRSLASARSELESERNLMSSVLASADDAIISTDADGRIVTWNATAERTFGYLRNEAAGMPIEDLFPGRSRELLLSGRRGGNGVRKTFEVTAHQKDGGTFPARVAVAGLVHQDLIAFTLTVSDLSDRVRARELEGKLIASHKLEALGRLAGSVAHDFNNLLTVILGNCELARSSLVPGSDGEAEIKEAVLAASRAATLTRQLLMFSKRQVVAAVVIDLADQLSGMRGLVKRLVGERIELEWKISEDPPPAKIDPGQFEQIILNLAVNAKDAMRAGGRLKIEMDRLSLEKPVVLREPVPAGDYARVRVSDTGVGIEPAVQERLFEPFFSTKGPDHGTGLGLATIYGIVKQCDGFVNVVSSPGRGSTFEVLLPASRQTPAENPSRISTRPANLSSSQATILLVDDNDHLRIVFRKWLERVGLRVIVASDGLEALSTIRSGCIPDVIVADVVMPRLGGPELISRLRRDGLNMPVLFISGYIDDAAAGRELPRGSEILAKPMEESDFIDRVLALVESGPIKTGAA